MLRTLSYRERRVLELRYGLDGQAPRTLDEIGRAFRVTRERIRQIETQSLQAAGSCGGAGLRDVLPDRSPRGTRGVRTPSVAAGAFSGAPPAGYVPVPA